MRDLTEAYRAARKKIGLGANLSSTDGRGRDWLERELEEMAMWGFWREVVELLGGDTTVETLRGGMNNPEFDAVAEACAKAAFVEERHTRSINGEVMVGFREHTIACLTVTARRLGRWAALKACNAKRAELPGLVAEFVGCEWEGGAECDLPEDAPVAGTLAAVFAEGGG